MPGFLPSLRRQLGAAAFVAATAGTASGLLLALGLLRAEHSALLLRNASSSVWAVLFLSSGSALLWMLAFLPVAVALALGERLRPSLGRIAPRRFYLLLLVVGSASLHAFLDVGFNRVRDLATPRGIGLVAAIAASAVALLAAGVLLGGRRAAGTTADGEHRRSALLAPLLLLGLLLLAPVSYRMLQLSLAAGGGGTEEPARAAPALAPESLTARANRTNVLLISIDTLRADHLSCYGYGRPTTPVLDALAREGVLFRNARSQAPWTLPSHASMLTGLYPTAHGARFFSNMRVARGAVAVRLDESHLTLAEMLRAAGRRTAAFTSVTWLGRGLGLDQGFDTVEMDVKGHDARTVVDKGLAFLAAGDSRPFFLFLHFFDVHNYAPPADFDHRFHDDAYRGQLQGKVRRLSANLYESLSADDLAYAVARYDEALLYVDHELGRLFQGLSERGLREDTLIVVTSDHGEEFWDHGGTGHGFTLYEDQLRVPLLLKPPAGAPIRRAETAAPAGVIDVVPTVLDYLDLPPLPLVDGLSLRPVVDGEEELLARLLFAEDTFYFNSYAVVENGFKYLNNRIPPADLLNPTLLVANLRSFYKFRDDELYDVAEDPAERSDLRSRQGESSQRMKEQLVDHVKQARTGERLVVDQRTLEELRSLGYIR